ENRSADSERTKEPTQNPERIQTPDPTQSTEQKKRGVPPLKKYTRCFVNQNPSFCGLYTAKIFHTQGGFLVLTLLAFGDEMYYICIEIWEEPRLPPFFVTFPLKTGVLGAHPGKICLPLI
ncbi:MAG: hypothetical protein SOR67_06190, partial [Alloprevotella sp.]|nr:hypothetical protein [Alloprevotella sp.]